jgi:GNAT superfamily N-acetyltransferase
MELRDITDKPEDSGTDSFDKLALERRLQRAKDVAPAEGDPPDGDDDPSATFRYYDMDLRGEVRTSVSQEGGLYNVAQAQLFREGTPIDVVGTARYSVAGGEATLDHTTFNAPNHGTEWALLKEVSERARAQGAGRLRVWVPDGDATAERRWLSHGFQPAERDPNAGGVHWELRV